MGQGEEAGGLKFRFGHAHFEIFVRCPSGVVKQAAAFMIRNSGEKTELNI